jgi:hypothetical protein
MSFSACNSKITNVQTKKNNTNAAKIKTNKIKITILDVYKGTEYNDTCMSEINIW